MRSARDAHMNPRRGKMSDTMIRTGVPSDAAACGQICYDAFASISAQHNFPCDIPSVQAAVELMSMLLAHPGFFSLVAEIDGEVVGSNFLDERSLIAGLGPITVSPTTQNKGVGRQLMQAALDRVREQSHAGVRLLQSAYHSRSLALYATLGFVPRGSMACMQGAPLGLSIEGYVVRQAEEADLDACNRVCMQVHGHDRGGDVRDAIRYGTARIVEHDGRVTGYATDLAFHAHAVGETNNEVMALIGASPAFGGSGILVPLDNGALFQWCLQHRLRVVQVMTLMTIGLYNQPAGAYLPSILY